MYRKEGEEYQETFSKIHFFEGPRLVETSHERSSEGGRESF